MKLIIQPDEGLTPLTQAIKRAKQSIDIVIFRFDRPELEKALKAAVQRGVVVRALIAHTNRGGEKILRKLSLKHRAELRTARVGLINALMSLFDHGGVLNMRKARS